MKKSVILISILLFLCSIHTFPYSKIDEVDKILYVFQTGNSEKAVLMIKNFQIEPDSLRKNRIVVKKLISIADTLTKRGKFKLAENIYEIIKKNTRDYWQIGNSIEKLNRLKGGKFYSMKNLFTQISMISRNFEAKFFSVSFLSSSMFYATILLFFVTSFFFFVKKFKLASTDIFIDSNGDLKKLSVLLMLFILFWPLIFLGGWAFYPFLISGFFWLYLDGSEKKMVSVQVILVLTGSLLLSFNNLINKEAISNDFVIAKNILAGKLYGRNEYTGFDNDLKVLQSFEYFKSKDYEKSLDILLSTGENYKNILKFNLMGNIYFRSDNYDKSIKYLKAALEIDESDRTALYNFATVLSALKNPKVYKSYSKRFPALKELKKTIGSIKDPMLQRNYLWKRLLAGFGKKKNSIEVIIKILKEFIKLPFLYLSFLFILYILFVEKIFPTIGESDYCKKCNKIINKNISDKSNNYCDQCYELFQLKDVIFMEAKISREEELKKISVLRNVKYLIISIFLPGFNFLIKKRGITFTLTSFIYLFFLIFSLSSIFYFNRIFGIHPIYLNMLMIITALMFLIINFYSLKGNSDGI